MTLLESSAGIKLANFDYPKRRSTEKDLLHKLAQQSREIESRMKQNPPKNES